ncbi:MAG TPA: efflux RND transporter periplasmic adaptor subunit [Oligoflexia bacterium]|nr:efflux RND transporter periplasmic adaptor subunit [Oligoflexia bacterium]HMP49118.1 efflux RND transporter periplasmic adaptor subunit [Oligoflexia bacterium]
MKNYTPNHFLICFALCVFIFGCESDTPTKELDKHEHGHEEESERHIEGHEERGAKLSQEALETSGVTIERVAPAKIAVTFRVNGLVVPTEEKTAHVIPRFAGVAREVRKGLGDEVKANETVAIIESNQSLQTYEVKSFIGGTITKRHITRGEFVSDSTELFEVIDLSELYIDLFVFAPDFSKVKIGQKVRLTYQGKLYPELAAVSFISPLIDDATQSKFIRLKVTNEDRLLSPGAFLVGDIVLEEFDAPLAVQLSALQTQEGKQVVFVKEGEGFEPRPVVLGRTDALNAEVLGGLSVGEEYAAGNTFIIKAELGKGAAEHDH